MQGLKAERGPSGPRGHLERNVHLRRAYLALFDTVTAGLCAFGGAGSVCVCGCGCR